MEMLIAWEVHQVTAMKWSQPDPRVLERAELEKWLNPFKGAQKVDFEFLCYSIAQCERDTLPDCLQKIVSFWLSLDQDVELSASSAPYLPVCSHTSHHDDNRLNL